MFVVLTQDIASGQIRTDDLRFTKPLLYHLSYAGIKAKSHRFADIKAEFGVKLALILFLSCSPLLVALRLIAP